MVVSVAFWEIGDHSDSHIRFWVSKFLPDSLPNSHQNMNIDMMDLGVILAASLILKISLFLFFKTANTKRHNCNCIIGLLPIQFYVNNVFYITVLEYLAQRDMVATHALFIWTSCNMFFLKPFSDWTSSVLFKFFKDKIVVLM